MKQKAALLFGILGDIPWEYKSCPLFLAKKERRNGWNTNVAEGQGWVAGMRWKFSVAENYRKTLGSHALLSGSNLSLPN